MNEERRILITGGAGFIGSNCADYFLQRGYRVTVFDNLMRKGSETNLAWLQAKWKDKLESVIGDVRTDQERLIDLTSRADVIIHLAAQVAVTTSVKDPQLDFGINAQGTLNVLEAARRSPTQPLVIYSSTNKVYGEMLTEPVALLAHGYRYADNHFGISEAHPLDFHSPYGCSKGAADQYVRDYHRIYGLPTVVFRQSCIYGTHQFGIEDQGWVAWFVIRAVTGQPVTIYGDGWQSRDVLFIDDLCRLYEYATQHPSQVAGEIFNVGGGSEQTFSLLDTIALIEKLTSKKFALSFSDWRPGDQKIYISDIRKIGSLSGWKPQTVLEQGLGKLVAWVEENRSLFGQSISALPSREAKTKSL
jgi:CDP-paratose 2-epimerase